MLFIQPQMLSDVRLMVKSISSFDLLSGSYLLRSVVDWPAVDLFQALYLNASFRGDCLVVPLYMVWFSHFTPLSL